MKRAAILIGILLLLAAGLRADTPAAAGAAAHGAEKVAHETAHPAEGHGEGHAAPKTYFGMPGWILKLVNLFVFLGLLGYLLAGPIRKSFDQRRQQIQASLQEARERRARADRMADEIRGRMEQLERDVQAILQRATEEGERQQRELIAAAETEAAKILSTARAEVDARVKMARGELMELAGDVATKRAVTLLEGSMTAADQRRIFEESVEEIEEIR